MNKTAQCELQKIPGVGKSISLDLQNIGIRSIADLKDKNPEKLYNQSNLLKGVMQDKCLLYVFRCVVYFADNKNPDPEEFKWWDWKDKKQQK